MSAIFISENHPGVLLQRPTSLEWWQSIGLSSDPDDSLWSSQRTICKSGANSPRPNARSKTAPCYQQAKCQDKLLAAVKLSPSMSWHKLRKGRQSDVQKTNLKPNWTVSPWLFAYHPSLFKKKQDHIKSILLLIPSWNSILRQCKKIRGTTAQSCSKRSGLYFMSPTNLVKLDRQLWR